MFWTEIGIGITALILGLYYWLTSNFDYWVSRGVPGPSPLPFVGNLGSLFIGRLSIGQYLKEVYDENPDEKMVGIFMGRTPTLILMDPDLIKDVLIRDFSKFSDRGLRTFDKTEPLTQHLGNLEPARWRLLRNKLSPIFTSGKLRQMFYLLCECGNHLEEYLNKLVAKNEPIECRGLTAKFTTDVIGKCVFGLEMNALLDDNSEFRKMGRHILARNWKKIVKRRIRDFAPSLYAKLGPILTDWKLTNFFLDIMRDTVAYRKNNGIVTHDFIDLLRELRDNNPDKIGDIELTDTLLASQLFVFFLAGFETSSSTISNGLYELAQNQQIQDRLRDEINIHLAENNGKLTYDGIKSMKYLHMVVQETLRKYPPVTLLLRKSTEPYSFTDTKWTAPVGTKVVIPVFAIQRDSRIYPSPDLFDPDRFTEEAIASRHRMGWLAFGDGPRNCIGARFAYYQSKIGLIKILQHYKVEVSEKTEIPYVIDPRSVLMAPPNGIYLKISKLVENK